MSAIDPVTDQPCVIPAANPATAALRAFEASHPFWSNELFAACKAGWLTQDDFRFVFGQYYLYSKNFTRYLSGLMANLDDDLLRSRLSENLWEEGGGAAPEKRHAQIFRNFLTQGLGIEIAKIEFLPCTRHFVDQFLGNCIRGSALHSSAFLSLGTEAIVARMYAIMVEGLLAAGVPKEQLEFFYIHMACDDAHAATLEDILCSFQKQSDWERQCREALDLALRLRADLFNQLMAELKHRRVAACLQRIQDRKSLLTAAVADAQLKFEPAVPAAQPMYENKVDAMNIDFTVDRAPFPAEVLDARVVRIPPGKANERHKHAHETIFYFLAGTGRVMVDDRWIAVQPGDSVFVPRWSIHQSQNQGDTPMVILAITDFYLTGKALVGDYESTARMKRTTPAAGAAKA
jgi:oxalate decarboxylase/phosphoglucose isomerase-like protein (cupin superfamily)/pyrroloquinoline quinone (PQQ) biosynthesis protein C